MSILDIDCYYIGHIGMVLNDTESTVIDFKSMISEYYHEYLELFGEIAASQLPSR
jgi:hypothetical protein